MLSLRFLSPTTLRRVRNWLFVGTVLASGTAVGPWTSLAHAADDESASLDALERQMARIQAEQRELQKTMLSMQKQIAAHRAALTHGGKAGTPTTSGHHVLTARNAATAPGTENTLHSGEPETGISFGGDTTTAMDTHAGHGVRHASDGSIQPVFSGANEKPEVDAVIGHRAEDIISRIAENGVGPHARETAGAQAAGALGDHGVFHMGPVTLILGGFLDASTVLENRHIASGTFNYWQAMPYPNESRYHTNNFEGSARYSRISLMARGNVDAHSTISGFYEMDFGAGADTTDAYESNSYAFRMRQLYLAYDNSDLNFHFLAGQAWSMLTPGRIGIIPRQESLPETIESSMLAGQTWARQLQFRFVKDFLQHRLWLGLSIENSATLYDTTGFTDNAGAVTLPNGKTATISSNGTGLTNDAPFSNEIAPDVIAKVAWDPSWGHYEAEGILHFPHDRVASVGEGRNHTAIAGGGGGSMVLPVVPHKVEVRLAGLAGVGIGRYGSVLLPDATLKSTGEPVPIPSVQATGGVIAHPNPLIDVYGYFGYQAAGRRYSNYGDGSYGYGNPNYSNAGCEVELSTLGCTANTRSVMEATIGAWYRFFKGKYGTVEAGAQLAYSRRDAWKGQGGAPDTSMSQIFLDFRYLPFQ
ncbi:MULTISPECIES: hypothetical protein [Acetobacter]|uniref:Porin n=1 Tax=Acetobacter tropicalis NBRC 101654 TaxID=749388 RepID=F7VFH6_9PROT|nr:MULTISPECIES: hypothetical protein [Acetobacter]MCC6104584.1 hypothetical protein [Acetobacter sp.]MCG4273359.1 hypothetical protein [Acetobacter senegalensis]GAA09121.1 hypothetical protein ATPR_2125 [Acetobacter tropicalis NBRC 101654]